jgi:TPR repeat protein
MKAGQGVDKADPEEAFKLLRKGCSGVVILRRCCASVRPSKAASACQSARRTRTASKQVKVLVPVDPKRALDAFRMAAQAGVPQAFYAVGVYYESGTVVDKDPVKAFALIKRAADSGIHRGSSSAYRRITIRMGLACHSGPDRSRWLV